MPREGEAQAWLSNELAVPADGVGGLTEPSLLGALRETIRLFEKGNRAEKTLKAAEKEKDLTRDGLTQ